MDIFVATAVGLAMCLPLIPIVRSKQRLTWATAVLVATLLTGISIVLIGEVPSRILYWFDETHATLGEKYAILKFLKGDTYVIVADIVANTVQGIFFVAIAAGAYFWGERHRKQGRF